MFILRYWLKSSQCTEHEKGLDMKTRRTWRPPLALFAVALIAAVGLAPKTAWAADALPVPVDGVITLEENTTISDFPEIDGSLTIDLNQHTLTYTAGTVSISGGDTLTIKNGTVIAKQVAELDSINKGSSALFSVGAESSITIDGAVVDTTGSALFPLGTAASVTVNDSTIFCGVYAVGTNASSAANGGVIITLTNSNFITGYGWDDSNGDSCPVMINVPGELNMSGCTVVGTRQAVLVRGGSANIEGCDIRVAATNDQSNLPEGVILPEGAGCALFSNGDDYLSGNWSSGNEVPAAALVVGNRVAESGPYNYPCIVEVANTTVSASEGRTSTYIYSMNEAGREVSLVAGEKTDLGTVATSPGNEVAYGTAVASINGTNYSSLDTAIALAGENDTVTLVDDTATDVVIPAGKTLTLDLNGHTITSVSNHTIVNNGALTIADSSGNDSGTIDSVVHAKAAVVNSTGATLTISGGTFTRSMETVDPVDEGQSANSWYTIVNLGTIQEISGGVFRTGDGTPATLGNRSSLIRNGDGTNVGTIVSITGGTFTSAANVIKNEAGSTITSIAGGTFTMDNTVNLWDGGNNILQNSGTINSIKGGTFQALGSGRPATGDDGTWIRHGIWTNGEIGDIGGDVVLNMEDENNQGIVVSSNGSVNITGGSFAVDETPEGSDRPSTLLYVPGTGALTISGGTYSEKPADAFLTSGYEPYQRANGTYGVAEQNNIFTVTINGQVSQCALGEKIAKPADLTRPGYTFMGWYETTASEAYDFDQPVTGDLTLQARWSLNAPTVTLEASKTSAYEGETVTLTATAQSDADVTYSFEWLVDGQPVKTRGAGSSELSVTSGGSYSVRVTVEDATGNVATAISEPVEISFSPAPANSHTVTLVLGFGQPEQHLIVTDGEILAQPKDPAYEGYTFVGWFTTRNADDTVEGEYDFTKPVTEDLTLYAGWVKDSESGKTPTTPETDADKGGEKTETLAKTSDPTTFLPAVVAGAAGVTAIAGAAVLRKRQR